MPLRTLSISCLLVALTLTGCANPRWSDGSYRPLGEPQAVQRK
ncbi:MAG TPA: type VI secretion protein [Pseudomonas sp.]|nr:type VI secretion protein [Pseudomonas sp.]